MIGLEFRNEQLLTLLLLLVRCSGIFVFTPFLGSVNIPIQVRVLLSFALSYLLALNFQAPVTTHSWSMIAILLGLAGELLVGMVLGFAAYAIFAGLQFAGQLISFEIGLSLVNTIDPQSSSRSATLSVYQNYLGVMLFLGFDGHHWFIQAIQSSLAIVPPYSMSLNGALVRKMVGLTAQLFVIGFQVAAPVTAVIVLTDFVLGLIGRSAPQIQILIIGFPIKILTGLSALGLTLYFLPAAMRVYAAQLHSDFGLLIQLLRR